MPKDCGMPAIRVRDLHGMGLSDREEQETGTQEVCETIMAENMPRLCQTPNHRPRKLTECQQVECQKYTPKHIIFKLEKIKARENSWKKQDKKNITDKEAKIRITRDFSEIMQEESDIVKYVKKNNHLKDAQHTFAKVI